MAEWCDEPTILETDYAACVLGRSHINGVTEVPQKTTVIADMHGVVNQASYRCY